MAKNLSVREHISRNNRLKKFKKDVLPLIALEYDVLLPERNAYTVLDTPKGDIVIYPKGQLIYIKKNNEWIREYLNLFLNWHILKQSKIL